MGFSSISRENNINAIRYYLAICILMNHFCVLTGIDVVQLPRIFGGAGSFFAISGFLMFPSYAKKHDVKRYLRRRADRIFPPYFLIVLLAAILCVFVSSYSWTEYFTSSGFWKYLLANLSFLNFLAPGLPGVFDTYPNLEDQVNGSLWTMKGEVVCYLTIPLIFYCLKRHEWSVNRVLAMLMAICGTGYICFQFLSSGQGAYDIAARQCMVMFLFYMGGWLNLHLSQIRKHWKPIVIICGTLLMYAYVDRYWKFVYLPDLLSFVIFSILQPLATGLMVIVCSVVGRWGRMLAHHNALTYEIYLFHFPIIQTLVHYGVVSQIGFYPALLLTIAITCALAWLSWRLVGSRFYTVK